MANGASTGEIPVRIAFLLVLLSYIEVEAIHSALNDISVGMGALVGLAGRGGG